MAPKSGLKQIAKSPSICQRLVIREVLLVDKAHDIAVDIAVFRGCT